jgi:hypothetical protein
MCKSVLISLAFGFFLANADSDIYAVLISAITNEDDCAMSYAVEISF